jgi:hypothetical protein
MAPIHTLHAFDQSVRIFRITGLIDAHALLSMAWSAQKTPQSSIHLWDFTHGSVRFGTAEGGRSLFSTPAVPLSGGTGIQTALVCPNELDHGLVRIAHVFAHIGSYPRDFRVFRCIRAAQRWLGACRICLRLHATKPDLMCAPSCTRK